MKNQINISSQHLEIVREILKKYLPLATTVRVFGSRASNKNKKFSDLDLAIDASQPLDMATLADLRHEFEESDLPFKVDVVDWATIDESFKKIILNKNILLTL